MHHPLLLVKVMKISDDRDTSLRIVLTAGWNELNTTHAHLLFLIPTTMTIPDEQQSAVATAIYEVFSCSEAHTPVTSAELLASVIAHGLAKAPNSRPVLRLTDGTRFEHILESLSRHWEHGVILLARDGSCLTIMDVQLGAGSAFPVARTLGKRGLLSCAVLRAVALNTGQINSFICNQPCIGNSLYANP